MRGVRAATNLEETPVAAATRDPADADSVTGGARGLALDHLYALTAEHGLFEHARYDRPRRSHGLCTDDNARALVVLCRLGPLPDRGIDAFGRYLRFVERGAVSNGSERGWHNRMDQYGRWRDIVGSEDSHGRALWGLGVVAAAGPDESTVRRARNAYARGPQLRSSHLRAVAYAVLGASAVAESEEPEMCDLGACHVGELVERLPVTRRDGWQWPEDRMTYANARITEAMIAAGMVLGRSDLVERGVELLDWLVEREVGERGFSFTPVGGRGPDDFKPGFDQQPVEAWAMADACARAFRATGEDRFEVRRSQAVAWFFGGNDAGVVLFDQRTGAGFDGLTPRGRNENRGAESTLAALGAQLPLVP